MLFSPSGFYEHRLQNHPYDSESCFVCGVRLNEESRTREHVIPEWMQHEFNLWDKTVNLLNGTTLPYRQLTVPCCWPCNNQKLEPLEDRISKAIRQGAEAVRQLPRFDLFRWLAKVYLGLQYKDACLPMKRSDPNAGTIVGPEFIRPNWLLHHWLQLGSVKGDPGLTPGSLWIFDAQVPEQIEARFDLADNSLLGVIAVRCGPVVIAADFLENGVHREQVGIFRELETSGVKLHPEQFRELVALLVYGASLIEQKTHVEFFERGGQVGYRFEWEDTSKFGVMREWQIEEYAEVLAFYMRQPVEHVFFPPNTVMRWLHGPDGKPVQWNIGQPHPLAWVGLPDWLRDFTDDQTTPDRNSPS